MMKDGKLDSDDLDESIEDQLAAWGKAAAGLVPVVGGFLGEMIGSVIPGQRADRIVKYLRGLEANFQGAKQDVWEAIRANAEKIDLIEEGGYQAARATSSKRIDMIIEAVSKGLDADESEVVRRKRLLVLLGELDEDEVAILNAYGQSYGRTRADRGDPFEGIYRPEPMRLGGGQEIVDQNQLYLSGQDHLIRLKLLKKNYGALKKGQQPVFDPKLGDFPHRLEVSPLGRLLLKEVGMPSHHDRER